MLKLKNELDIQVKDLNSDDGVETLIIKLKSLFAKDINQVTVLAYDII